MFTHGSDHRLLPSLGRSLLAGAGACALVLAAALASPAAAQPPVGWEKSPPVSAFDFIVVLLLIPLAIAAVLSLLTILPSLARERGYEPGQAWRSESEWFGGPTKGVESAATVTPEQIESRTKDAGGTSASW